MIWSMLVGAGLLVGLVAGYVFGARAGMKQLVAMQAAGLIRVQYAATDRSEIMGAPRQPGEEGEDFLGGD
jgi:hypothetical protein